jgi:gas vesicle protein
MKGGPVFLLGLFIGVIVGIFTAALLAANDR